MQKEVRIVRDTAKELEEMVARGESLTDWDRVDRMTDEEIEAKIATDEESELEWGPFQKGLSPGIGQPKKQLTVHLDQDVIDRFKAQGKGYQTRMSAVLRQFMEHEKERAG